MDFKVSTREEKEERGLVAFKIYSDGSCQAFIQCTGKVYEHALIFQIEAYVTKLKSGLSMVNHSDSGELRSVA